MLYPSFFAVAIAAVISIQHVAAAPLEVKMGDGNAANKKTIQDTMPLVNQKINNMKAVIDRPDTKSHPAVVKAFGANANVEEIRKNVNILATSKIMVPHTDSEPGVTQGATNTGNKHVTFGSTFYSSDANTRAGTIIHEATHAKTGTVDHFKTDGTPGTRNDPGVRVGYKDSHMSELNQKHSDQMHHNADAYRVFGDECPNVRRSLYRRAMEEPHPVIRSVLLRRAAHACAWKPKAKPKNAAADHKTSAGAKHLEKNSAQKSATTKRPLYAAKTGGKAKGVHKVTRKKSPLHGGVKKLIKVNAAKKAAATKATHTGGHSASSKKVHHAGMHAVSRKTVPHKPARVGTHSTLKKTTGKASHTSAHAASKKPVGKVLHSGHKRVQGKSVHHDAAAKPKTVHHTVAAKRKVHHAAAAKRKTVHHAAGAKPKTVHHASSAKPKTVKHAANAKSKTDHHSAATKPKLSQRPAAAKQNPVQHKAVAPSKPAKRVAGKRH